jgi:hypothetical protein
MHGLDKALPSAIRDRDGGRRAGDPGVYRSLAPQPAANPLAKTV